MRWMGRGNAIWLSFRSKLIFFVPICAGLKGEVLHSADALAMARTSGGYHDALDGTRKRNLVKHRLNFTLRGVCISQLAGKVEVKVHDDVVIGRDVGDRKSVV